MFVDNCLIVLLNTDIFESRNSSMTNSIMYLFSAASLSFNKPYSSLLLIDNFMNQPAVTIEIRKQEKVY